MLGNLSHSPIYSQVVKVILTGNPVEAGELMYPVFVSLFLAYGVFKKIKSLKCTQRVLKVLRVLEKLLWDI